MRASAGDVLLRGARASVVAATLVTALAVPRGARAGDVVAARRDFAEGVRLYQRGDFEGARRLFQKANAEHHAAPMVYNLALAEERLAHHQAAVDAYEAYVAEAGDAGEFRAAAAMAIAQIKARSTRLRIDTKPSGARVFVDGSPLSEPAPTLFLVPAGRHVIVAQGDGWRGEEDIEARGAGDVLAIVIKPKDEAPVVVPPAPPASAPLDSAPPTTNAPPLTPVEPAAPLPDQFIWGAAFVLAPYHMLGAAKGSENAGTATQVVSGAIVEVGHAMTDRVEFLARGLFALGPYGKPTYAFMGGPGISLRIGSWVWLGATFIGGGMETIKDRIRFGTGIVFGTIVEASFVVLNTPHGQWTVGVQPGTLLTDNGRDNAAFFVPLSFGYRSF